MCKALHKKTGKHVAIKRTNKIFDELNDCKRILREIVLLKNIKHPSLIKIVEILQPKDEASFNEVYIVMEYCQSDLKKLFKKPIYL